MRVHFFHGLLNNTLLAVSDEFVQCRSAKGKYGGSLLYDERFTSYYQSGRTLDEKSQSDKDKVKHIPM
jgi:hypothetical protein